MKKEFDKIKEALMTGVGYMIPFIVFGGISIAIAITFSDITTEGVEITNPILETINSLGELSMGMMVPILAGFIAYGLADRAGIMPGMLGGLISDQNGAGFLGGLVAGIIAGYVVNFIKKLKVPANLRALVPIFIIPLLGGGIVALIMEFVVTAPISTFMTILTNFLENLQTGNVVLLAVILGVMTAFDMGGPVNVVATLFAWSLFSENIYTLAGPVGVAIATPPLGMGIATLLAKDKYDETEREAGTAAIMMGMIGISEGAIPFAAKDPFRVILANCIGGAVGAVIAMLAGVEVFAPHGGPIVVFVTEGKLWYLLALLVGSLVTALIANFLKFNFRSKKEETLINN